MVTITAESPFQPDALDLLIQSVKHIQSLYTEEWLHSYKLYELSAEGSRFFMVRQDGVAIGCGAYIRLSLLEVEFKHIFLVEAARGVGAGKELLTHMGCAACSDGAQMIVLETTLKQPAAIHLYTKMGFRQCMPYASAHAGSVFMSRVVQCGIA